MDDGKGWVHDDENGNFEGLSSYAHLVSWEFFIEMGWTQPYLPMILLTDSVLE